MLRLLWLRAARAADTPVRKSLYTNIPYLLCFARDALFRMQNVRHDVQQSQLYTISSTDETAEHYRFIGSGFWVMAYKYFVDSKHTCACVLNKQRQVCTWKTKSGHYATYVTDRRREGGPAGYIQS